MTCSTCHHSQTVSKFSAVSMHYTEPAMFCHNLSSHMFGHEIERPDEDSCTHYQEAKP